MSFIKLAIDDIKEGEVVPEGEYDLRIVSAKDGASKAGNEMTTVMIKIEDAGTPNPNLVGHWLVYPADDADASQKYMRLLDIKRFLQCFGIAIDGGFDSDDLVGQTGRAFLKQEQGENGQVYNRIVLPRLKK